MPQSLVEMFHGVFDPRSRHGLIHDLVPTLSLAVVAILAGRTSLAGIARFGRDHNPALAHALGFRRGATPSVATFSRLFRRLDVEAVEAVLGRWIVQRCPDLGDHFALDGKALRRSRDGDTPAVHLLAVFAPRVQAVIGQLRVDAKTNEHKAALTLLGVLPSLKGKVVTGDAMFCQTEIAEVLEQQGADYVPHVKDNPPTVRERIAELLDPVGSFSPGGGGRSGRVGGPDGERGARPDRGPHGAQLRPVSVVVAGEGVRGGGASDPGGAGANREGGDDSERGVLRVEPGPPRGERVRLPEVAPSALGDRERFALHAG